MLDFELGSRDAAVGAQAAAKPLVASGLAGVLGGLDTGVGQTGAAWSEFLENYDPEFKGLVHEARTQKNATGGATGTTADNTGGTPAPSESELPPIVPQSPSSFRQKMEWPVRGSVTGKFGESRPGHMHAGLDIAVPNNTPVKAPLDGKVVDHLEDPKGYGHYMIIEHSKTLRTLYAHLTSRSAAVGQWVSQGDVVAMSGNSGRSSGPHLHFEVRVRNVPENPQQHIGREHTVRPNPKKKQKPAKENASTEKGKNSVTAKDLKRVAGGQKTSAAFREKVIRIAQRLGMEPQYLMAVMSFETGESFSSSKRNPASSATGLIQFLPSTARGLGTSIEELSRMSNVKQLDYVAKYLKAQAGNRKLRSLEDTYMSVLYPAAIGKGKDHVLFRNRSQEYTQNAGLDQNRDGRITVGEAATPVRNKLPRDLRPANTQAKLRQQPAASAAAPVARSHSADSNRLQQESGQILGDIYAT